MLQLLFGNRIRNQCADQQRNCELQHRIIITYLLGADEELKSPPRPAMSAPPFES